MAVKRQKAEAPPAEALTSWEGCNDFLRNATESQAKALLELEQAGKRRVQYLLRIHARYNRQRAERERAGLLASTAELA